jgi:hypothetical protein
MPYFVDRDLNIYTEKPFFIRLPEIKDAHVVCDTEFTQRLEIYLMTVDCVGIYIPELCDYAIVWTKEELTEDFHPILYALDVLGYDVTMIDPNDIVTAISEMQEMVNGVLDFKMSTKKIGNEFKKLVQDGFFDDYLNHFNLTEKALFFKKNTYTNDFEIILQPDVLNFTFLFFYGFADFFKIWGKNYQEKILQANLTQQRNLKLQGGYGSNTPIVEYNDIDGTLYECKIGIRDVMNRLPPLQKGLSAQTQIFGVSTQKMNVKTKELANKLGCDPSEIMANFTKFLEKEFKIAIQYHSVDLFATWDLHLKQQEFLDVIYQTFLLESEPIKDTTGANVSKFIIKNILSKFGGLYSKDIEKDIRKLLKLMGIDNLEQMDMNDFGCQPFLTVGGLLFTRMARLTKLVGKMFDCDLKSCYASFMAKMHVYLGEPVTITIKYDKYKATLREVLELIENKNAPDDGWFVRVSGKLDKAINTLVMTDLKFKPKNIRRKQLFDINKNRKSIEKFNGFKTPKSQALSVILTKEIKFGLITKSTIEALKKLPLEWYEEYLDLKADVICYYPGDLIAYTYDDYLRIRDTLPDESVKERVNIKLGIKEVAQHHTGYKNNAILAFNIGEVWSTLKDKRAVFKKAKNPVQEIFKLFGNSGYGVLACTYLASNNLVASNQITAGARTGAWLMVNALNGCGVITDGTAASEEHIPYGRTFHQVLKNNPEYVVHFDKSIQSGIVTENGYNFQDWIDKNLRQHMIDFYQIGEDDYNLNQFDYELKTEFFPTKQGEEFFKENPDKVADLKEELGLDFNKYLAKNGYIQETTLFTSFYNNNSGNYAKSMDGCLLVIDGQDVELVDNTPTVKARGFRGSDKLVTWYIDSFEKYTQPLIYPEVCIFKLGDGNQKALTMLSTGSEEIAHPMGFSSTTYKLMKLCTRSQFLFKNESQLRNFETNEETLANLSKIAFSQGTFWSQIKQSDVDVFGVELREGVDYETFAKNHPIGIGFELLTFSPAYKGDIGNVRNKIVDLINDGCENFNAGLHISRNLKYGEKIKYNLAAIVIAKKNADDDLRKILEVSASEPTLLSVNKGNIKRLEELLESCEEE